MKYNVNYSRLNEKRLSPLNTKRSNNNYLFAFVANHLIHYPTLIGRIYAWSFGFLAGMCLLTQVISENFLTIHYASHVDLVFSSLDYIMRDLFQTNGSFCFTTTADVVGISSRFLQLLLEYIGRELAYGIVHRILLPSLHSIFSSIRWIYTKFILYFLCATAFQRYILIFGFLFSFMFIFESVALEIDKYLAFQTAVKKQQLHDVTSPPLTSEYNFQYEYKAALKENRVVAKQRINGIWKSLVTGYFDGFALVILPLYLYKLLKFY